MPRKRKRQFRRTANTAHKVLRQEAGEGRGGKGGGKEKREEEEEEEGEEEGRGRREGKEERKEERKEREGKERALGWDGSLTLGRVRAY